VLQTAVDGRMQKKVSTANGMEHAKEAKNLVRRWLEQILEVRGWNAAQLARETGVSPSTISRALSDDKFVPSTGTIAKIAGATGIGLPADLGLGTMASTRRFSEPEAEPFGDELPTTLEQKEDLDVWRLKTRALDQIGYLPGDLVAVDRTAFPKTRDIVCAQVYDLVRDTAETVFREFDPPYLLTRTSDPKAHRKPLVVDDERVLIVGVVVRLSRMRRGG
jgi:transcriptional regulator with XRE-family HTH domain